MDEERERDDGKERKERGKRESASARGWAREKGYINIYKLLFSNSDQFSIINSNSLEFIVNFYD